MLGEGLRAGLRYMGIETRACCFVEREAYPASVLAARIEEGSLEPAPVWSDLLAFDGTAWRGAVDGIVAGFPCQDLSLAGRRAGLDGKRSGLFFDILDIADDCGAWFLFLENVSGIASATATAVDEAEGALKERAASRVLGELADRGWHAEWLTLSASDVGASHGRARWFCLAWRRHVGHAGSSRCEAFGQLRPGRRQPYVLGAGEAMDDAYHAIGEGRGLPAGEGQERADPRRAGQGADGAVADADGTGCRAKRLGESRHADAASCEPELAHASSPRQQGGELGRALHGNRGGGESTWTS